MQYYINKTPIVGAVCKLLVSCAGVDENSSTPALWCYRSSWDEPPLGGSWSSLAVYITARKRTVSGIAKKTNSSTSFYPFCIALLNLPRRRELHHILYL